MFQAKWMYRKHPELGHFDRTMVTTEQAEKELLEDGWSEDPTAHGFKVRPATQIHTAHIVKGEGLQLHEVVPDVPSVETITADDVGTLNVTDGVIDIVQPAHRLSAP